MKFLLMLVVGMPVCVHQGAAQSSPKDVVREFFKAETDGRWLDAARLLDLKHFERMRQNAVKGFEQMAFAPQQTPEDLMRWEPDMPRLVAEYQVRKLKEQVGRFNVLEREYARVSFADSLRALSTEVAAARWLEAKGSKYQTELAHRDLKLRPPIRCPDLPDSVKKRLATEQPTRYDNYVRTAEVLASATASDSVAYVVVGQQQRLRPFRLTDNVEVDVRMSPAVVTLNKVSGAWRIVPTYDLPNSEGDTSSTVFMVACADSTAGRSARKK